MSLILCRQEPVENSFLFKSFSPQAVSILSASRLPDGESRISRLKASSWFWASAWTILRRMPLYTFIS